VSSVRLPLFGDLPLERERQLQQLLSMYIATGLLFMLLPGTLRLDRAAFLRQARAETTTRETIPPSAMPTGRQLSVQRLG
jgi:hypothetical protein